MSNICVVALNVHGHAGVVADRSFISDRSHPIQGEVGAGKVAPSVRTSGDPRKLATAIETLEELVGRMVTVRRGFDTHDHWPPYHIEKIDYGADSDLRCVVMRTFPNGSREYIRRSIGQVTSERKYAEANAIITSADSEDLWAALDARLPSP